VSAFVVDSWVILIYTITIFALLKYTTAVHLFGNMPLGFILSLSLAILYVWSGLGPICSSVNFSMSSYTRDSLSIWIRYLCSVLTAAASQLSWLLPPSAIGRHLLLSALVIGVNPLLPPQCLSAARCNPRLGAPSWCMMLRESPMKGATGSSSRTNWAEVNEYCTDYCCLQLPIAVACISAAAVDDEKLKVTNCWIHCT
jgi:hypothetical protein